MSPAARVVNSSSQVTAVKGTQQRPHLVSWIQVLRNVSQVGVRVKAWSDVIHILNLDVNLTTAVLRRFSQIRGLNDAEVVGGKRVVSCERSGAAASAKRRQAIQAEWRGNELLTVTSKL